MNPFQTINQSNKNQRGRPRATNTETIIQMAMSGKTDEEIARELSVSRQTVIRYRKEAGIVKPRGGTRPGAGRKRANDKEDAINAQMKRDQFYDCILNSWEVGIGRKHLGDEDWVKWAPDAFLFRRSQYRRNNLASKVTVEKDGKKTIVASSKAGMGVPAKLPRSLPWPEGAVTPAQAWDAVSGGTK